MICLMKTLRWLTLGMGWLGLAQGAAADEPVPAAASPAGCRWQLQPEGHLALLGAKGPVWQLNFRKEETKPYFHPLATPGGCNLTWHQPPDHLWHRALWFSWKLINGANYWDEDPATGKFEGLSDIVEVQVPRLDPQGATVVIRLSYHPPEKPSVLEETRTLKISAADEDGSYRIDWHQRFTAAKAQDAMLDRTPPKEAPWGGYGGLSYRADQSIAEPVLMDSEGRRNLDIHGQNARWVDATGRFGTEQGGLAGVAIFDHPSNPRHPTPWHIVYEPTPGHPFVYSNPALLFNEPLRLPAGESLELRYRVLIHTGPVDAGRLQKEFQGFSQQEEARQ